MSPGRCSIWRYAGQPIYEKALNPTGQRLMSRNSVSLRTVGEVVAVLSVVGSLVFVALEVRQNTIASRAAAYQAIGLVSVQDWQSVARDPGFSRLLALASDSPRWHEIDETGWAQLKFRYRGSVRAYETVYLQVREGLLPQSALGQWGLGGFGESPTLRRLWPEIRPPNEEFALYLERRFRLAP